MRAKDKDLVFGHSHYDHGLDVLGGVVAQKAVQKAPAKTLAGRVTQAKAAVTPRAGFIVKKTPGGRAYTSLVLAPSKKHLDSVKNAKQIANRAKNLGNKILASLSKMQAAAKSTKVHGAVLRPKSVKHAKHLKLSLNQMKRVAKNLINTANKLNTRADKHSKFVSTNSARLKSGVGALQKQMNAAKHTVVSKTKVHGDDYDAVIFGTLCEILGQDLVNDTGGDTGPDAGTVDTSAPDAGAPVGTSEDPLAPGGDPTYGLGPAPTLDSVKQTLDAQYPQGPVPASDQAQYSSDPSVFDGTPLPEGAIIYDGSHGMPGSAVASWHHFYRQPYEPGKMSGFDWHDEWTGSGIQHGKGWMVYNESGGADTVDDWGADGSNISAQKVSLTHGWGPLVGNPNVSGRDQGGSGREWTVGLRYDAGGDQWFWYWDQAPDWAKMPQYQAELNKQVLDYNAQLAAAKADAAAQALQDKLDEEQAKQQAKQQAAEDAAMQRQMEQEQKQAEHDAALQAIADDRAASEAEKQQELQHQQDLAQAEIESKAMLTQAEIDRQAMEEQAAIEQRAIETAARLEAMQPPAEEGEGEETVPEAETEGYYDESGEPTLNFEQSPVEVLEGLYGADKLRYRKYLRSR